MAVKSGLSPSSSHSIVQACPPWHVEPCEGFITYFVPNAPMPNPVSHWQSFALGRKAGRTNRAASTNRTESRAKNARARARKNVNDLEDISMYRFKFKEREWKELNECDGLVE
jgi:hypothetical protein